MNSKDQLIYSVCQHFLASFPIIFANSFFFLILGLVLFIRRGIWIVSKALIIWCGTGTIRAWKTILEIAKLVKTIIRLSRVRFQNCQFQHTLCAGNDFEEVTFFYSVVIWEISTKNLNCFITNINAPHTRLPLEPYSVLLFPLFHVLSDLFQS